jgi:hypothetical protein
MSTTFPLIFGIKPGVTYDARRYMSIEEGASTHHGYNAHVYHRRFKETVYTEYANMHYVELSDKELVLKRWDFVVRVPVRELSCVSIIFAEEQDSFVNKVHDKFVHSTYRFDGVNKSIWDHVTKIAPEGKYFEINSSEGKWFDTLSVHASSFYLHHGRIHLNGFNGLSPSINSFSWSGIHTTRWKEEWDLRIYYTTIKIKNRS